MFEQVLGNPWVRAAGALLLLFFLGLMSYLLSPVLIPLFFAFIVAYVLDPVVDKLEAKKISRTVSIGVLASISLMVALAVPLYVLPSVVVESDALIESAREGMMPSQGEAAGALRTLVDWLPLHEVVESLGWGPEENSDYDPLAVLTVRTIEMVREPALLFLKSKAMELVVSGDGGGGVTQALAKLGGWFTGSLMFIGNLALFSFVAVYLLKDYDQIITETNKLIPLKIRPKVGEIASKIDTQLKGFLRGQVIVCACLGTMYAIGLSVAGVPFAILLGVFGAFASFIPYLGLTLTIGPAMILCVLQYQSVDGHLAVVLVTFVVAQTLEGTLLTPKIVGDQVGLGPVWVILAILVFSNALGFLGLLLAVPIAASLKVLVVEGLDYYKRSDVYQGEVDSATASDFGSSKNAKPSAKPKRKHSAKKAAKS